MNTKTLLLIAGVLTMSGPLAIAAQMQGAPGGGTPAAGGKGPGMGHDYRRNVGGPGMGPMAAPADAPTATPQGPGPAPPPGLGYRGYPAYPSRGPGMTVPNGNPGPGRFAPGRQGYGYPGYRGQGGSPYPGHRQYGNPPGYPPAPRQQPQPQLAQ